MKMNCQKINKVIHNDLCVCEQCWESIMNIPHILISGIICVINDSFSFLFINVDV
jgi:hypothetical protein